MLTKILVYCFMNLLFALKGDGVSLSLTPESMVIGSSVVNPVMSLTIKCSSDGTTDIRTVTLLKISRRKFTEPSFMGIVSVQINSPAELDPQLPQDIQQKSPNVTGSIIAPDLKSGTLTLSLNAQGMTCADQAEFNCTMAYNDIGSNPRIVHSNMNFTVLTVPSDVIMDSPEYYNANGNTLQLTNNSVLAVGTRIKFRCMANVGSLPGGEIIWERTSEMGLQNLFITYTPTPSTDIVQEESQLSGCFYRRTSTMYYNLTKLDDDGISFRCKARSYLGGQLYEALANQQYRAVTASSGGGGNKSGAQEGPPAQAGTIAGAVIGGIAGVVLIIVLVYFLWYRRRSSGESYRTKEEGERPEPPPTDYTYSMPDKKKMEAYDNKALDDNQDKTTRYPRSGRGGFDHRDVRNDRGHHNPGMDDEDGGAMHMGHGPIGTGV